MDSTENFEDVGHSSDAREMLEEYYIGTHTNTSKEHKRNWVEWSSLKTQQNSVSWAPSDGHLLGPFLVKPFSPFLSVSY